MDTAAASSGRLVAAASGGLGATRVKAHSLLAYRDAAFTAKPAPSALPADSTAANAAATAMSSIAAASSPSEATAAAATSGATAAAVDPSEASRAAACAGNIADHRYRGIHSLGEKPGELETESVLGLPCFVWNLENMFIVPEALVNLAL